MTREKKAQVGKTQLKQELGCYPSSYDFCYFGSQLQASEHNREEVDKLKAENEELQARVTELVALQSTANELAECRRSLRQREVCPVAGIPTKQALNFARFFFFCFFFLW